MSDCLFCSIVAGEIPANVVLRTDEFMAFTDIDPQAPVHTLVIPIEHHESAASMAQANPELAGRLLATTEQVARDAGINDYRLVFNTGASAGQSVFHVHGHVLGGRDMTWPPG